MRKENSIDLKRIFSAVSLKRIQSNLFVVEIVQNFCEKLLTNSANGNCPQSTSLIQQYNWEQILPHSKNSTCYKDFWKASNRTHFRTKQEKLPTTILLFYQIFSNQPTMSNNNDFVLLLAAAKQKIVAIDHCPRDRFGKKFATDCPGSRKYTSSLGTKCTIFQLFEQNINNNNRKKSNLHKIFDNNNTEQLHSTFSIINNLLKSISHHFTARIV